MGLVASEVSPALMLRVSRMVMGDSWRLKCPKLRMTSL